MVFRASEGAFWGVWNQQHTHICRCQSILGLVCEQKYFKINILLHGEPMLIDEDRGNVILFAPFGDDTSRMILTLLKLGYELLRNTKL